ncbi:MAG: T9SS type A sorting domain-containing protein [candidate division WOR-3 bacterium]
MKKFVFGIVALLAFAFADVLLFETFDPPWSQNNPPLGWEIIYDTLNPQSYADWHQNGANAAPWNNHPTPYAAIWWQLYPNNSPDIFISPVINCSRHRNVVLTCSTYFSHKLFQPYTAQIRYSIDGGATFPYVLRDYHGQNVGPGVLESLNLSLAAREESVRIAWIFDGDLWYINHWFFDDVIVTGDSIPSYDISCKEIVRPKYYELPGDFVPHANFANVGLTDQYDIPVFCELMDSLGHSLQIWNDTIDTLFGFSGEEVVFFDSISYPLTVGRYSIKFWCDNDPDYDRSNDTLSRDFIVSYVEELFNDDGSATRFRSWPVGHCGWGVKFSVSQPVYIESLKVYLASPAAASHCRYQLAISRDNGGVPGPFIFKTPVLYSPPLSSGWNSVFLADTGEQIIVSGDFYVFYLQVGEPPECPQLGMDNQLNNPDVYWCYYPDGTFLPDTPPGDLMIRAFVNYDTVQLAISDARVTFIEQPLYEFIQRPFDAPCPLVAHIENFGIATLRDIAVVCSVIDPSNNLLFSDTVNVPLLDSGQTLRVEFAPWTPLVSQPCSIIVHTTILTPPPDDVPENDDKRFGCDIKRGVFTGRNPSGYAWIDSDTTDGPVYSWIDTTGFSVVLVNDDDAHIWVPIGFKFPFSDTTYQDCYVCTNGWLSLGSDPHTNAPNPHRLPFDSLPNAGIYPWWDDLVLGSTGKVYYKTIGTQPNRQFVVIWSDVNRKGTAPEDLLTFEVILKENGCILFQYKDVTTGDLSYDYGKNISVGIENKEGHAGLNYLYSLPPMSLATNDPQNRLTPGRAIKLYREFRDAAALEIIKPESNIFPETINPVVKVQNYGTIGDTIMTYFRITPPNDPDSILYLDSLLITGIKPGAETTVTFATSWCSRGTFTATCSVVMTEDVNPGNDIITKTFGASPWVQRQDVPFGPTARRVKNGSLVYASTTNKLYALKGSNTNEFYAYDIATGTWDSLASMPTAPSGRRAKEGCDLTFDPFHGTSGTIWAIKGGGKADFYSYDIATNSWTLQPNVQNTPRLPQKGACLACVPTYGSQGAIYCAVGKNSLIFLRYDIDSAKWTRLPDVPFSAERKRRCRHGTDMVYDGDSIIYLLKGSNTTEVWKYSPVHNEWRATPLDPISLLGRSNRRVKDGGAITFFNNNLYVLKGGNTQEFWRYDVVTDTWLQRTDIPFSISGFRRKVKRGSALAATESAIFCLKGSSTWEFWEYRPHTDTVGATLYATATPRREGVMAEKTALPTITALSVYPNPNPSTNITINYALPSSNPVRIQVYDITGTLVKTLVDGPMPAGRYAITWNCLTDKGVKVSAGVYFLKLKTATTTLTQKLVIQH